MILQLCCEMQLEGRGSSYPLPWQYGSRGYNTAAWLRNGLLGGSILQPYEGRGYNTAAWLRHEGLFNTAASPRILFTLLNAAQPSSTLPSPPQRCPALLNAAQPSSTLPSPPQRCPALLTMLALLAAARSEGVKVQEGGREGGRCEGVVGARPLEVEFPKLWL